MSVFNEKSLFAHPTHDVDKCEPACMKSPDVTVTLLLLQCRLFFFKMGNAQHREMYLENPTWVHSWYEDVCSPVATFDGRVKPDYSKVDKLFADSEFDSAALKKLPALPKEIMDILRPLVTALRLSRSTGMIRMLHEEFCVRCSC